MPKFAPNVTQSRVLIEMLKGERSDYDMFSFGPGFNPEVLSQLHRAGVLAGNHRYGFSLTIPGQKLAIKCHRYACENPESILNHA